MAADIRRRFADLAHGQIHYREAGEGEVLLLLHGSPGSSRQLEALIETCSGEMRVIATDTPGNGDSAALPLERPTIVDLGAALRDFLTAQGISRVHIYGTHTGAAIAAEMAIAAPGLVRTVVFDGIGHWQGEALAEVLANYALPFAADLDGAYLARLFAFCRDQFLFYPWYRRTREARRDSGLPPIENLHNLVVEVMKASTSYHRNYNAAFQWDAPARLPLIGCPVLFMASTSDPLFADTRKLARQGAFAALPRYDAADFADQRHEVMRGFFASEV